jgi:RNA methyltransferase, TrmH family
MTMTRAQPSSITSRDNALLQRVRRLNQDSAAYRRLGQVWLEGEHLCTALLARGGQAAWCLVSETAWLDPQHQQLARAAARVAVLPDKLFASISTLDTRAPRGVGYLLDMPPASSIMPSAHTVVLDRVQDAGNVGSILRSAAAFGVQQVLALQGTAALWSPKVLRAGMGAHFALRLVEQLQEADLAQLSVPLLATSSHAGAELPRTQLPKPAAWVLGHEGQGVAASLLSRCALQVRIPQPGGEESLNVAAAAAVCLYESAKSSD